MPRAWWTLMVQWLALLTRIEGDVGSIPARSIYTNFSDKCLLFVKFLQHCRRSIYHKYFYWDTHSANNF